VGFRKPQVTSPSSERERERGRPAPAKARVARARSSCGPRKPCTSAFFCKRVRVEYHLTLGWRVIQKKKKRGVETRGSEGAGGQGQVVRERDMYIYIIYIHIYIYIYIYR